MSRAISFAKEAGARITFFYAEPEAPPFYAGVGAISSLHATQDIQQRFDGAAKEILDVAEDLAATAGVQCRRQVLAGDEPYELIIRAAETNACDLIFMASHGRRGVSALLLGSETSKVLTHSKLPVLVFR